MARNDDLFQYLPENILVSIVSLLPFKEAIRTSVLSKKWQHIWRYTRSIEFDENFFTANHARRVLFNSGLQAFAIGIRHSGKKYLVGFAKKWMDCYQDRKVDNLLICFSHPTPVQRSDIDDWIRFAISKNVEGLDLNFSNPDEPMNCLGFFDFPDYIYQHITLRSLKLDACGFDPSKCTKLSALRNLSLSKVNFSGSSFQIMISNCKVLEILTLKMCSGIDTLELSSPDLRLTSLVIDNCKPLDFGVTISAPKLRSLKYFGFLQVLFLVDLPCLLDVELNFGLEEQFQEFGDVLVELLRALYFAKVLTICSFTIQVIPSGEEPLYLHNTLSDLKHLILKTGLHTNELPGIALLLRSCIILDTLTIEMGPTKHLQDFEYPLPPIRDGKQFWDYQIMPINCVKKRLKIITINGFKGTKNEVEFLRYLLFKGRALRSIQIITSKEAPLHGENVESYAVIAQKVLQFQRASPFVRISIH